MKMLAATGFACQLQAAFSILEMDEDADVRS